MADIRKQMPSPRLDRAEFSRRFRARFYDPAFEPYGAEIERLLDVAWDGYSHSRKSPRTHPAGPGYADPGYALSDEWRDTKRAIDEAERQQKNPAARARILLVNGAARTEHTCPGETSKSYRLALLARAVFEHEGDLDVEFLDLSRMASEYERVIYPCKTCVSTAMPLCHWPCSCYPNHSLGQVNDWMNEIYPMWVAAHGIMIISPVNWYASSSVLKLMIDRLVCADGGNPDPTSTAGKDAARAKAIELAGWSYPRHLAGRVFAVVVHGDADGARAAQHALSDWLTDMGLVAAGPKAELGSYIGYMAPYATSHAALDQDRGYQDEVRNAARTLARAVRQMRRGELRDAGEDLADPRPK